MIIRPIVCRRFIGRAEELAYLHERRRDAGASHGGVVLVSGEAGVGKSRLLSEFGSALAQSRWRVGIGRCLEFAQRPYGPILEVLARFDAQAAELAPAASKQEQFETIFAAFERAAARTAIVAVIEDLHWADAATIELLAYLGARIGSLRMLIVATFRAEEFHPEHPSYAGLAKLARAARAGRIDLAPLSGPELRSFIDEALSGIELAPETRRAVARASDGNPFFVEELLKSAVERAPGAPAQQRALPTTVRATLMERLGPLTADERRVLAQAAVIGRYFDLPLLAATLGADPESLVPALRRAREMQLIEEYRTAEFRFRHALTREAIYGDFLAVELRPLHREIANVLEHGAPDRRSVERLAYHWWAAGDAERAARYNELAGDAAGNVHAHEDALAFFERAAESAEPGSSRRGALLEKVGDRAVALGLHDAALAAFTAAGDAFERNGERDREASCRVRAAVQAYSLGRPDPTAPLEAMLERLDPDDYLTRGRVHLGIAWIAVTFYRPTEARRHVEQVDARALDTPDVRLRFHNVRAWMFMVLGDAERFRAEHGAWLAAAHAAGGVGLVAPVHYNGAYCYALLGCHADALRNVDEALRIARAEKSRHAEAGAHAMGAFARLLTGDLHGTRAEVDALRAKPTDNQVTTAHGAAWGTLAGAHLGDERLIEYWFDRLESAATPFASLCGAGYAEIMVRRGRLDDARNLLGRIIDLGERPRGIVLTLLAVARYGADDDLARARAALAASADAPGEPLERYAVPLFDAYVSRRHGRHADAARSAALAADGFARLGFALLEAAAREIAGERDAALAIYRRCGAAYDVGRLEGRSPAPAGAAEPAGGETQRDPLSAREREIAARVMRGGSNIEIARELSISHKTVEKHLGSIFQKLGFSSRAQLAAYVSQGKLQREPAAPADTGAAARAQR
jgi:DNA-binding NarL/FixJ family response regulator